MTGMPIRKTNMNQSSDWVKFTLDLPQVYDPGTYGLYCTGGVVTLGQIIENQSEMRLDQFADQNLFEPLGITNYKWKISGDGRISGGGGELIPQTKRYGQNRTYHAQ